MKYLFGSLALLALLAPVHADSSSTTRRSIVISIPPDFAVDTEQAAATAAVLNTEPHLGGLHFSGSVEALRRPEGPVAVFITSMMTREKVAYPDAAIHSEFEQLRTSPTRSGMSEDEIEIVSWKTSLVEGGASARSHWRHRSFQTATHARALAFRVPSGHLHYVLTECLHPTGEGKQSSDASATCKRILDSMALPADLNNVRAPVPAPASPEAPSTGALPTPVQPTTTTAAIPEPAAVPLARSSPLPPMPERKPGTDGVLSADDATHLGPNPQPVIAVPREKKRDYRNLLIILGGLLLVVGFYLSTRSRNAPIAPDDD